MACCISEKSGCFLIWLGEHALSVAILVYLFVSAVAIPVSSALFDGVCQSHAS
jgi:hypothetical protein